MNDKTRNLTGLSLDVARRLTESYREGQDLLTAMQARHEREAQEARDAIKAASDPLWTQLLTVEGIPLEEVREWGLDARYLKDHGQVFMFRLDGCSCGADHDAPTPFEGLMSLIQKKPGVH